MGALRHSSAPIPPQFTTKWRYNFDIKHGKIKKPLFFDKLYRHCTGFSEYVPRRYDSKQTALGEPKHVIWQSFTLWNPSIFDGINQKKDIYVLLF